MLCMRYYGHILMGQIKELLNSTHPVGMEAPTVGHI